MAGVFAYVGPAPQACVLRPAMGEAAALGGDGCGVSVTRRHGGPHTIHSPGPLTASIDQVLSRCAGVNGTILGYAHDAGADERVAARMLQPIPADAAAAVYTGEDRREGIDAWWPSARSQAEAFTRATRVHLDNGLPLPETIRRLIALADPAVFAVALTHGMQLYAMRRIEPLFVLAGYPSGTYLASGRFHPAAVELEPDLLYTFLHPADLPQILPLADVEGKENLG